MFLTTTDPLSSHTRLEIPSSVFLVVLNCQTVSHLCRFKLSVFIKWWIVDLLFSPNDWGSDKTLDMSWTYQVQCKLRDFIRNSEFLIIMKQLPTCFMLFITKAQHNGFWLYNYMYFKSLFTHSDNKYVMNICDELVFASTGGEVCMLYWWVR